MGVENKYYCYMLQISTKYVVTWFNFILFDRYYVNMKIDNYNRVYNAPHKLQLNTYKIKITPLKNPNYLLDYNDYIYN